MQLPGSLKLPGSFFRYAADSCGAWRLAILMGAAWALFFAGARGLSLDARLGF
jgi:hypothetical protein